ncbi:MAG: sigma factor [Polyangiaceae bacterium]
MATLSAKERSWGPNSCRLRLVCDRDAAIEAERLLCAKAKAGDRRALGELLRTHGPRLYRSVLLPRLGQRALAEEALATTYARVVERFEQFVWQDVGIYPWLRVIAFRVAIDHLRRHRRERLFQPEDLERTLEATQREEGERAERLEQQESRGRSTTGCRLAQSPQRALCAFDTPPDLWRGKTVSNAPLPSASALPPSTSCYTAPWPL